MKTAVLVHGHHLGTTDWEQVEWGDPAHGVYGNIPKGLVEAQRFDAETIIFGTGVSSRDGLTEGEYAVQMAQRRAHEIPEFASMTADSFNAWFSVRAVTENSARNTPEEVRAGAYIAKARGAERLIQIACRTHSARAHNAALAVLKEDPELSYFLQALYTIASDSSREGTEVRDVVIIEPPHRPDRQKVYFNKTLRYVTEHLNDPEAEKLNLAIARAIEEYRKNV